jgi:hypothetical protein
VKLTTLSPLNGRASLYAEYSWREGHAVAQLVKALCYKPEGRGSDYRYGHSVFFNLPNPSSRTQPLTEMNTRDLPGDK